MFPGKKDGCLSEQIAYFIEKEIYPLADFIIDLHGGDSNEAMTPLVFFPVAVKEAVKCVAKEAAMHLPVQYRIPSSAKNGLYSYATQCDIPALLLEIGGNGRWQQVEVEHCIQCVNRLMAYLEMLESCPKQCNHSQVESQLTIYEEADTTGFWYPYVSEGHPIKKGMCLGEIRDIHDKVLQSYVAKEDGVVLYYTTALGVSAQDPLVAYAKC